MRRMTVKDARAAAERVREALGRPAMEWRPREDGRGGNRCNVGAIELHVGSPSNGIVWAIQESMNDAGGVRDLIIGRTAEELVTRANAYLDGFYAGQRAARPIVSAVLDRMSAHNWRGNADEAHVFDAARAFVARTY